METIYIPGGSLEFKAYIDKFYNDEKAELRNIDGHNRWVITREDGIEYIARPEEAK